MIDFSLETLLEKNLEPRKLGKEIETLILPYIKALKSAIDQSHFVTKVSKATAIKEEALWLELKKVVVSETTVTSVEQTVQGKTSSTDLNKRSAILKKLLGIILWQESEEKPVIDVKALRANLKEVLGQQKFDELFISTAPTKNDIVFEAERSYQNASNLEREITELLINLEVELIEEKLADPIMKTKMGEGKLEDVSLIQKLSMRREELINRRKA